MDDKNRSFLERPLFNCQFNNQFSNQLTQPFMAQRRLFKAYDIRGQHDLFTPPFVQALSHTFAAHLLSIAHNQLTLNFGQTFKNTTCISRTPKIKPRPHIVVGHDMRHGSLAIAQQFAQTFCHHGIEVIWLGLITTPIMAFWANEYQGHGLIATASHSEKHINGLKWLLDSQSPSSDDIQQLYKQLTTSSPSDACVSAVHQSADFASLPMSQLPLIRMAITRLSADEVSQRYIHRVQSVIDKLQPTTLVNRSNPSNIDRPPFEFDPKHPPASLNKPLTIVIDCLNGATGTFANAFFKQYPKLCTKIIMLNDTPDGDFPKGNPDPTEAGRLTELAAAVYQHQADIGVGFDGDGDRLMVVDNTAQVIAADHLLYLLARVAIEDSAKSGEAWVNPPSVLFDVKCSHHLPSLIEQIGATPIMSKTGSSHMRKALRQQNALLQHSKYPQQGRTVFAGELSGHFLFNDGLFILQDDAMYAALRLIHWLSEQPQSLAAIINQLPTQFTTSDVYLPLTPYPSTSTSGSDYLPSALARTESLDGSDERPILSKLANLCTTLQLACFTDSRPDCRYGTQIDPKDKGTQHLTLQQLEIPHQSDGLNLPNNTRLTCIDGLRLDFNNGFGVIRPSNTSHCLTVRFAGDSLSDLREVQGYFVTLCQNISADLAAQIANISLNV